MRAVTPGLLLLAAVVSQDAGATELNGFYKWGGGEILSVHTHGSKVEGTLAGASTCGLKPGATVVTGEWQGGVLVGQVTLCQVGPGCRPAEYAFLGFYNAPDGTLTADLEVEGSCDLPALVDSRLILEPASEEEAAQASTEIAGRRKLGPHTAKGQKLLHENNARAAAQEFQKALERREDAAAAYHGLGLVQANEKHWGQAVKLYQRSLELRGDPTVYYNLACAFARLQDKRNAIANLRLAIRNGFTSAQDLSQETDLLPLLGKDPEFHELLAKLQSRSGNRPDPNDSNKDDFGP